jgi:hypothetical protein
VIWYGAHFTHAARDQHPVLPPHTRVGPDIRPVAG